MTERKIVTNLVYPSIPIRDFDWSAVYDDYDGPGCPIVRGLTEAEAIQALHDAMDERE